MSSREGNGKVNCKIMEMECSRFMMVAPNVALIVVYVAIVMVFWSLLSQDRRDRQWHSLMQVWNTYLMKWYVPTLFILIKGGLKLLGTT